MGWFDISPHEIEAKGQKLEAKSWELEAKLLDRNEPLTKRERRILVREVKRLEREAKRLAKYTARKLEATKRKAEAARDEAGPAASVRKAIPERVRHEVWRRDAGRCVECGNRERLEYDHIIPISKGGSNTARNLELRCETCNRSKGARI